MFVWKGVVIVLGDVWMNVISEANGQAIIAVIT
jgi:hypothetical protein